MEQELRQALAQYRTTRQARDEAQILLTRYEIEALRQVCSETNDAGKAKYSNAELRDAEVKARTYHERMQAMEAETNYLIAVETLKTLRAIAYSTSQLADL